MKIELRLARERQPLEARGLARQVFRDDPGAQFVTAESGERRAAGFAEQWRDRAADARAEAVELRQLPTDQAANRIQTKHQAAAEQAARAQQLAERLRQKDPYRPTHHQADPHRSGPSLGL